MIRSYGGYFDVNTDYKYNIRLNLSSDHEPDCHISYLVEDACDDTLLVSLNEVFFTRENDRILGVNPVNTFLHYTLVKELTEQVLLHRLNHYMMHVTGLFLEGELTHD